MNHFRQSIGQPPARESEGPLLPEKGRGKSRFDDLTSISIKRQANRGGNTRGGDRHRLKAEEVILVTHDQCEHVADLINVSQGGAMIRTDLALELWQPLMLDFGDGGLVECAVRWLRDDRAGLEFTAETQIGCDAAMRDSILLSTIRKSFPQHAVREIDVGQSSTGGAHKRRRAGGETRVARRHPLIWSGTIHYEHDTHKVRLRNISETGAMIDCGIALPVDAGLLLDLGEAGQLFSFVSWSRGGQAGLIFEEPYDVARLAEARPQVAGPPSWQAPDYLRKMPPAGSPWVDHWMPTSLEELSDELEGFMKR